MKKIFFIAFAVIFCFACQASAADYPMMDDTSNTSASYASQTSTVTQGSITVIMTGFRNDKGRAQVALFDSEQGFPFDPNHAIMTITATIENGSASTVFTNVPTGEYAISVFHDEDMDAEFDRNWIFLPAEGFGTSNNPGGFWGPGGYKDSRFTVDSPTGEIDIYIHY